MDDSLDLELTPRKLVRIRVRPDLVITPQRLDGRTIYVVKDPVSLHYLKCEEREHFLFQQMDGQTPLEEIRKRFEQRFIPELLPADQLELFSQQLLKAGLAYHDTPEFGKQLIERGGKRRWRKWLQILTNPLYVKIPLFDPDRLLGWLLMYSRWIFTTWFLAASIGVLLAALTLVASHFDAFREKLPAFHEFFSFHNLVYLWVALAGVKIIHEFGHGLSCKAFGGEVHEMGALFMCLAPSLYCNVTDSWMLPSKWRRIVVGAAGIYVELMIASLAAFVWWNSPNQPFLNHLSLDLIVVCSVSTVVFNANPLMRFDGYYVLSDWLEVPNLRERSNRFLLRLAQRTLGMELEPEPSMSLWRTAGFVVYAVSSHVYRWVVTFGVLWFLYNFLKPYRLGAIGELLAFASIGSMVGWPLYRLGKYFNTHRRLPDMNRLRAAVLLLLIVFLVFVAPFPVSRIRQTGLVQVRPESEVKVYVQVPSSGDRSPGVLERLHVRDGQVVPDGYVLAEFKNPDLETELEETETRLKIEEAQIEAAREQLREEKESVQRGKLLLEVSKAEGERGRLAAKVEKLRGEMGQLELRAPQAGVIMSPPKVEEVGRLWDRERTAPFCSIGDPGQLQVLVPISTADYRLLDEDRKSLQKSGGDLAVTLRVQGRGAKRWNGKISLMPESPAKEIPLALSLKAGGPVPVKPSDKSNTLVPQSQQYLVAIGIEDPDSAICPGTIAQVKISCRWRSLAWWVWRTIASAFDLAV